jgi:putative intracellular protease/amidase
MKIRTKSKRELVTRRTFIKAGAGATIATGCLSIGSTMAIGSDHPWKTVIAATYVCPPCGLPCDKIVFDKPGSCPTCGMTLVPADDSADAPPKVSILVFNGTELIDFAGPWEVFGTAGFLVHTVAEKLDPLTMVFGQKVIADYTFDTAPKSDILLVPGGGVFQQMENERLIRWIQEKSKYVRHVMSVCTGAFLLAKSGLLQGQTVTATYGMIEDLVGPQTKVVYDQRFVDNGKIITTAGLSSGIDGALHLVSKVLGKGNAQAVALAMEYPWKPDGTWARAAMADRYLPDGLAYSKPKIKGAEASMISTDGSSDHWETKILVRKPASLPEIIALLRERIGSNTASQGMYKPISHIRGAPSFSASNANEIKWTFADDQGRNWSGRSTVERSVVNKGEFEVTFTLARTG